MAIGENVNITITAKRRIMKFAEGANPETDQPFEVVEKEDTYEGQQAIDLLNQMGVKVEEENTNGTN